MELLRNSSLWENSRQGQCHNLARRGLFKNWNSDLAFRGGLIPIRFFPRAQLSLAAVPPVRIPRKWGGSGQSWERCAALGCEHPLLVPAGELKAFGSSGAFSLLLASKASSLIHLHGSAPTRPLPGCKSLWAPGFGTACPIALPTIPGVPSSIPMLSSGILLVSCRHP